MANEGQQPIKAKQIYAFPSRVPFQSTCHYEHSRRHESYI
ncbi:unnamed protein product [Rhodiola kirilowii]